MTTGQQNSIEGSILRELGRHELGKSQFEKTVPDDPEVIAALDNLRETNPSYLNKYLEVARKDYSDAGKRTRADDAELPWVESTNFERQESLLRCLTPEQRSDRAKRQVEEDRNPQWYNPIINLLNQVRFYLPNLNINIR